jgi:glycerophosphoryl diester phosphodiesterase
MSSLTTCLAVSLLVVAAYGMKSEAAVEIIAHRGASADAPENTLSAMRLAWVQGADAIELDLWLAKDGKIVVFHDADTKRFENQARRVPDLTWDELQQLDVGAWKGAEFKGERIPRLEHILATIPAGRRAVLEIKCGPEILPELRRVLRAAERPPKELAIISFNFQTMQGAKALFPELEHYFLHSYRPDPVTKEYPELRPLVDRCRAAQLDGLDLHFDWPIDRSFTAQVHEAGLKLLVWTVDDPAVARRLVRAGVDGITTNRPKWLREQLALAE